MASFKFRSALEFLDNFKKVKYLAAPLRIFGGIGGNWAYWFDYVQQFSYAFQNLEAYYEGLNKNCKPGKQQLGSDKFLNSIKKMRKLKYIGTCHEIHQKINYKNRQKIQSALRSLEHLNKDTLDNFKLKYFLKD